MSESERPEIDLSDVAAEDAPSASGGAEEQVPAEQDVEAHQQPSEQPDGLGATIAGQESGYPVDGPQPD